MRLRLHALAVLTTLPALASAQVPLDQLTVVRDTSRVKSVVVTPEPAPTAALPVHLSEQVAQHTPLPRPAGTRFSQWMVQDARALAVDLAPRTPSIVIGGAALLGGGMQFDAALLNGVQIAHAGRILPPLELVNELGGPKAFPIAGLAFGASLLTHNSKLQDAAFTSFQTLVYAGAVSYGLKGALGRVRPEHVQDARMLRPFSGNTSFPSGHTTQAFAIVTPWMYYYPGPITYSLVALAGGTAIARIARNKHWPTDIAAGAALGFATGRYLARRHLRDRAADAPAPRLRVDPVASTGEIGASLTLRLD